MTSSFACFCGNVYTAPPDRCEACGSSLEGAASGDAAKRQTHNGADVYGLRVSVLPDAGPEPTTVPACTRSTVAPLSRHDRHRRQSKTQQVR
jgi:hypothetical protein